MRQVSARVGHCDDLNFVKSAIIARPRMVRLRYALLQQAHPFPLAGQTKRCEHAAAHDDNPFIFMESI